MYFCSLSYEEITACNRLGKKIIDHSTLVKIRARLGEKKITKILELFTRELIDKKIIDGKYLFTDTTTLEKNLAYPTEIGLLSRVIEESQTVVQRVKYKKDLIVTKVIKEVKKIAKVYYSAAKKSKKLLKDTSTRLLTMAQRQIKEASDTIGPNICCYTAKRYRRLQDTGQKIINQIEAKLRGQKVADRIVSYYQDHSRALPKGKISKPCEFGVKLRVDMSTNDYITNYKLYLGNRADVGMLAKVSRKPCPSL